MSKERGVANLLVLTRTALPDLTALRLLGPGWTVWR